MCKLKHKDSISNTREVMVGNGAFDNWYNIRNGATFREWNSRLSRLAGDKYGVGVLYSENADGTRAIPNIDTFRTIDQRRRDLGIYESGERKSTMEEVLIEATPNIVESKTEIRGEHLVSSPGLPDLYLTDEEFNCK